MELSARTGTSRQDPDAAEALGDSAGRPGRHAEERAPGRRRIWLTVAAWVVVAVVIFLAAVREARQESVQSDGASIALQAWQMMHGNPLLKGWHVTDVSFYTTEMPVYRLVELIRGLRIDVVAISESINYTLTLVCGALVAKGRATGREGTVRALLAAGIMAAPTLAAANWLLNDADHAATALWVLLALLVLERAPRRWYVPVLIGILLAWAVVGDPLIEVIGCAPLLIVGVARSRPADVFRRTLTWRAWARERWFELSLAAAGLLSAGVGAEVTKAIADAGGWVLVTAPHQFVQATTLPSNVAVELQDFLILFSANFFGQKAGAGLLPIVIHLAGAIVVIAGIWVAVRRYRRGGLARTDLVTDVLVAGIVCNLAAYLLLYSASVSQIREVAPVFAFGAALAGRLLGPSLFRKRLEPLLALGIVCYLLTMGPALTGSALPPDNQALTGWLESHHLTNGLAGYWQTNSVTFDSGGRVTMRPVMGTKNGQPVVKMWETDATQLNPATNSANFLVLATGRQAPSPAVTEKGAEAEFGKPSHVYHYKGDTILVWNENLLVPLAS
jgi:hypothetical protein